MAMATFDTLKFAKALREAGVSEKHAEAEVAVLAEAFSVNFKELVTKDDLKHELTALEMKVHAKFDIVRAEMKEIEQKLASKIEQTDQKMNARFDQQAVKHNADITQLRWMLGAILTIVIGIGVRLIFMPLK